LVPHSVALAALFAISACSLGIAADDLRREADALTIPAGISVASESAIDVQDLTNRPSLSRTYQAEQPNDGGANFDAWVTALRSQGFDGETQGGQAAVLRRGQLIADIFCSPVPGDRICSVTFKS
jgi:hypothetical protein